MTEVLHLPPVGGSHVKVDKVDLSGPCFETSALTSSTNVTVDPPINFVFEQELDSNAQVNSEK